MRPLVVLAPVLAALLLATAPEAKEREESPPRVDSLPRPPLEPKVRPSVIWAVAQLIPSPELVAGQGGTRFGLRWQLTPLLYSFGIHRKLSPWRAFVVEPLVRESGSIELYMSPEYVGGGAKIGDDWLFRTGARAYFPLVQRGDNLSVSVGSSHYFFEGRSGAAFEVGAYVLFGMLGLIVTYSPSRLPAEWITTLQIRYF